MRQLSVVFLLALILPGFAPAAETVNPAAVEPPLVSIEETPTYTFPQRRDLEGYSMILHAPQIEAWEDFKNSSALIAFELTTPDGSQTQFGTLRIIGSTRLDMARRIVIVEQQSISEVKFSSASTDADKALVQRMATRKQLEIPVDLFLAQLADDVLSNPPPVGFNTSPPDIHVTSKPTILLLVNGSPVFNEVVDSGLRVVVNANWPLFQEADSKGPFYLLAKTQWLQASDLDARWKPARSLPAGFSNLPPGDEYAAVQAAIPLKKSDEVKPAVTFTDRPAELIVTDGKPEFAEIPGTNGLQQVSNTTSPLFKLEARWYYLVAGRWFTTEKLTKGPWTYSPELPPAFAQIPEDHPMASVLASVPGTVEAKMASLEALLPTTNEVALDAKPPVEVTYAGEPRFESIATTQMSRAVNSGYDIIQFGEDYYLCYAGIWYVAQTPTGPWVVTATVPPAVYTIPPSSPSYPVTQVTVVESTPTTVVYTYPPSYSSSVYVVYGVPYYGTGWYYPPYAYGYYYYPYRGSYGHGSWYNPATGGYGSRSVWYGPYGGYSYNQGYNPSTGRYGYMETGWDSDEWASHSETYNPRTGVQSETSRYFDDDKNKSEMERRVERGDDWVDTERDIDWDERTSDTQRTTSRGGESNVQRSLNDGTLTSSGSIQTGDGRNYSVEGEQTRQGGSSTISGAGGSVDLETQRDNGRSVTSIEGSSGGKGVSISDQGPGRTTIGQSGSGDLYAGHNGNVYKKTDEGWQQRQDGAWSSVETPKRGQADSISLSDYRKQGGEAGGQFQDRSALSGSGRQGDFSSRAGNSDMSRLNRDYSARQRGSSQFQHRSGGFSGIQRGGMRSGGGRRR